MRSIVYAALGVAVFASSALASEKNDLIYALSIRKNTIKIVVNPEFKKKYLLDDFFATYDSDIDVSRMGYSISTLPFILNVISIVWISGQDYYVEEMDKDVYESLKTVKKVFERLYPKTSLKGNLIPRRLINNKPPKHVGTSDKSMALLFSGGLDSTAAAFADRDKKLLLITVRGQWDVPLAKDEIWETRVQKFQNFTERYGHEQSFVRSNFAEFLNWNYLDELSPEIADWRLDTVEGLGMFGLAAPILYTKGVSLLKMAASYHWSYPWPSAANPLVDDNMVFANVFKFKHDQFDYTRAQKIELIVSLVRAGLIDYPVIKVCDGRRTGNCQRDTCSKCIPTAFALLAYGENPRLYGFDMNDDEIIERTKKYLCTKQLYWTLWELMCLKDRLGKRGYARRFKWFMQTDLAALANPHHLKNKTMVNWGDYQDLAPNDLSIPRVPIRKLK